MLEGMIEEAKGKFEEANKIYESIRTDDPSYVVAAKRKIGVLIGQGKTGEAIDFLNNDLETYMNDTDAWKELTDIYLSNRM